ncbi:hydrolase 2, exosortase A system-associated [soil metagenome]
MNTNAVKTEAFFLPSSELPGEQRFCIYHSPQGAAVRALIVYVHPFGEEMNKSRRMAALQARALAASGCAVLQIDLRGCGDSSGDFGDATWSAWVDDVVQASRWLQTKSQARASAPLWFWGLRAGCLLAAEAGRRLATPCNFLFWQPPAAGKPLLQQFLRLKLAGDMLAGKGVMEALRQQLAAGSSIEIAGYALGAELANGLEGAKLVPPPIVGRVEWIELSSRPDATILPASQPALAHWQAAGWSVRSMVARGPAFWQTVEIEEAPALIEATLAAIEPVHELVAA